MIATIQTGPNSQAQGVLIARHDDGQATILVDGDIYMRGDIINGYIGAAYIDDQENDMTGVKDRWND